MVSVVCFARIASGFKKPVSRFLVFFRSLALLAALALGSVPESAVAEPEDSLEILVGVTSSATVQGSVSGLSVSAAGSSTVESALNGIPHDTTTVLRPNPAGSAALSAAGSPGSSLPGAEHSVEIKHISIHGGLDPAEQRLLFFRLGNAPGVAFVEPNRVVRTADTGPDYYFGRSNSWSQGYEDLWGLHRVQAPAAWSYSKGEGIVVAVLDTGVDYNHPDLRDNIWRNDGEVPGNGIDDDRNGYIDDVLGWDATTCVAFGEVSGCVQPKNPGPDPRDAVGHGTHVAGIIAAQAHNSLGVAGVAPAVKIMPVKVLNDSGSGTTADIVRGIEYAVSQGAHIINLSLGGLANPYFSMEEAIRFAEAQGVLVIAAAGNDSQNVANISPANIPSVITVGASNRHDTMSHFSNFAHLDAEAGGLSPVTLAAPGGGRRVGEPAPPNDAVRAFVDILSLRGAGTDMYRDAPGYLPESFVLRDGLSSGDYYRSQGTSMAAPFVSGAAAVLLSHLVKTDSQASLATPAARRALFDKVRRRLRYSADPFTDLPRSPGGLPVSLGSGRLNVLKAVESPLRPWFTLTPDETREVAGNGDGFVQAGELFSINATFKCSELSAQDVSISLSVPAGVPLEVVDGTRNLGSFSVGSRGNLAQPFVVRVKEAVALATTLPLYIDLQGSSATGNFSQRLVLSVTPGARVVSTSHVRNSGSSTLVFVPASRPVISERYLLWTDTRGGSRDIYALDLETGRERLLSPADGSTKIGHPADQSNPAISGDIALWQDRRSGSWEIYWTDLSQSNPPRPLFSAGEIPAGQMLQPQIDGDSVVFTLERQRSDGRMGYNAFYFNRTTRKLIQLGLPSGTQINPVVSGNSAVWEELGLYASFYAPDVANPLYAVDISPKTWALEPVISGTTIAFTGLADDFANIYTTTVNPATLEFTEQKLTADFADQGYPAIGGGLVVWSDRLEGNLEIFGRSLTGDGSTFPVTSSFRDDRYPAVSAKWIAWVQDASLFIAPRSKLDGDVFRDPGPETPTPSPTPEPTVTAVITPAATPTPGPTGSETPPPIDDQANYLSLKLKHNAKKNQLKITAIHSFQADLAQTGPQQCSVELSGVISKGTSKPIISPLFTFAIPVSPSAITLKNVPSLQKRTAKSGSVSILGDLVCNGSKIGRSASVALKGTAKGRTAGKQWIRMIVKAGKKVRV